MLVRQFLISASLLSAFYLPAQAADLAPQPVEPVAPVIATAYSWTGFYAGINGGYAFGSSHHVKMAETYTGDPTYVVSENYGSLSPKGGFGGAQVGYNAQFGSFVLGLEGDIQGAGISDRTTATVLNQYDYEYTLTTRSKTDWFGTVRPRVGFAFDNILIYATGGVAFGGVKYNQSYIDSTNAYFSNPSKSDTRVGFALGGGIEYGITQNWSVKLEYQYVDLGTTKLRGQEISDGVPSDYYITSKLRTDFHTVRLGVNYRF